jgi:hypothetical protein
MRGQGPRLAGRRAHPAIMAATNKSLARNNKSLGRGKATNNQTLISQRRVEGTAGLPQNEFHSLIKPTTTIRFTESQIALVMRAHPNCNLRGLTEVSFEFDQAGEIVDCVGTIKDRGNIGRDYTGSGLARLYEMARRQLAIRQTGATILQFPKMPRGHGHLAVAVERHIS